MRHSSPSIILASQSPRRRQLLAESGYHFQVITPSESAEQGNVGSSPAELVRQFAYQKAADVVPKVPTGIVVGCDTVAECGDQILGKPRDVHHAREMLQLLSGRSHRVYSGLCLWRRPDNETRLEVAISELYMEPISPAELDQYLDSGAWQGKAGAFGYQDQLDWLRLVNGSESNVVGLPLELFTRLLAELS